MAPRPGISWWPPRINGRPKTARCPKSVISGANIKRRCLLEAGHKGRHL